MPGANLKSYLHLHFIVFIWGFTAVLGALITLDALPLVWFRMSIAVLIILVFVLIKKIPLKVPPKTLAAFVASGLVIALHWLTFFYAIKVSNVSVTLACLSTGAFFASLLEPIFTRTKVVWYEVLFGLIVVSGLYIIFSFEGNYITGIILALISAFLSALFAVINAGFAKKYSPVTVSFYELLGGVFFFSLYLLFTGSFGVAFFTVSANDWLWLFLLGSFCTAYAFIASVHVMKVLTPYTVMLTINMEPIYGIILAVLVFNDKEKMSTAFYIGAAVILSTVILNGIIKSRAKIKN